MALLLLMEEGSLPWLHPATHPAPVGGSGESEAGSRGGRPRASKRNVLHHQYHIIPIWKGVPRPRLKNNLLIPSGGAVFLSSHGAARGGRGALLALDAALVHIGDVRARVPVVGLPTHGDRAAQHRGRHNLAHHAHLQGRQQEGDGGSARGISGGAPGAEGGRRALPGRGVGQLRSSCH